MYNKTKLRNSATALFGTMLLLASLTGCSGIYDNIREYATEEGVYSNRFDGILKISLGFERIEIDLMEAGRVPASEIYMGRARKTVIECEDFTEPDHRRVIDSICSYVNITGLDQLKTYQFTIYTEDSYGNRSMPLVAEAKPYTRYNLEGLDIVPPNILGSSSAALLEWKDKITTRLFELLHYTYQYTDRDGVVHTGEGESDPPSFFVENVLTGQEIPVIMKSRIIPTLLNDAGYYAPIIDTVDLQTTVIVKISPDAGAVIFLKEPLPGAEITFPQKFSWVSVHEVDDYVLKVSTSAAFAENQTLTFPAGNRGEYELMEDDLTQIIDSLESYQIATYWTVEPANREDANHVTVQQRRMSFTHPGALLPLPAPAGLWEFEDPMMPFKATIGKELRPKLRTGNGIHGDDQGGFTFIAGPSADNGALHVLKNYWLQCEHGLIPSPGLNGSDNYTLVFDMRFLSSSNYHSLLETSQNCNSDQDFCLNSGLNVGIGATGYHNGGITLNNWYRIVVTYRNKIVRYFVNGSQIGEATNTDSRFLISPVYVNFFGDEDGDMNEFDVSEVRLYDHGLKPYQVARLGVAGTK